jgi:alpha-N-arabinofuranosidase
VRYATMLRHVDPTAELVACGYEDDWNAELLTTIGKHLNLVDHLSIHRYWIHGGPEAEFDEQDYYTLLAEAHATEAFIYRTAAIIRAAASGKATPDIDLSEGESATEILVETPSDGRRRIGIALDEWGVWHPEARPWGPGGELARDPVTYEQANTLRDALAAAIALEGFHRQCNVLTLANLAQVVNVLQAPVMTEGARIWLTPTYHALRLHASHIGATALPVAITHSGSLPDGSSAVSATASRTDAGLAITLINRHHSQEASVRIVCADAPNQASGQVLSADSPRAVNSAAEPDRVAPVALEVAGDGQHGWRVELPAHSLATVVLRFS